MNQLTWRQKLGLKILGSNFMQKAAREIPAGILRAMNGLFGINGPVYQIDNPEAYIKQGFHQNAIVYQVVNWIIGKAASVDFGVRVYQNGEMMEELDQHPLLDLLKDPNPIMGKQEFFEQYYGYTLTTGNGYIYGPRLEAGQNQGQTKEIFVLPAHFTDVVTGDSALSPVQGYKVTYGNQSTFRAEDVMHTRLTNLYWEAGEAYYGASPLRAGARVLTKSNSNEDAAVAMFQQMGLRGILSQDSNNDDAWTSEQVSQVERSFYNKFGGSHNAGKTLITNTAVRWQDVGLSPVDMALLEDHLQNLRTICGIYKVSSRLFNDPNASTYNNMEQDIRNAWVNAILPLVQRFVDGFNSWLCEAYKEGNTEYRIYAKTDNIAELQKNKRELTEWLGGAWWIDFNEKREAMGFDKIEGKDGLFYIPSQLLPMDEDSLMFDPNANITGGA